MSPLRANCSRAQRARYSCGPWRPVVGAAGYVAAGAVPAIPFGGSAANDLSVVAA
jgi:hypothetical protein